MQCFPGLVLALSSLLGALALLQLSLHLRVPSRYGKHEERLCRPRGRLPARCAWFLQELPSFLVPALLLALRSPPRLEPLGCRLLCCLFCWHYFYRYIGSACCGQEKRRVCGTGSSGGRRTQPWEYARGWPRAKPRSTGSARLCPGTGSAQLCPWSTGSARLCQWSTGSARLHPSPGAGAHSSAHGAPGAHGSARGAPGAHGSACGAPGAHSSAHGAPGAHGSARGAPGAHGSARGAPGAHGSACGASGAHGSARGALGAHGSVRTPGAHSSPRAPGEHGSVRTPGAHSSPRAPGEHGSVRTPGAHGSARRTGRAQAPLACGATAPKLVHYAQFVIPAPLTKYQFVLGFFFSFYIFSF
ncbi:3-oxo-5-alpha-steroid 4-dehydrogenase 2 isoform 1-T1 [Geothlypis trichas]